MLGSLSLITEARFDRTVGGAAIAAPQLLARGASPARASSDDPAACEGQTFRQPFAPLGDLDVAQRSPGGPLTVAVSCASTKSASTPKDVAQLTPPRNVWKLSESFRVRPQLGRQGEETCEVGFVFSNQTERAGYELYGLYVDPRMI